MSIRLHIHLTTWFITLDTYTHCDNETHEPTGGRRFCFLCFTLETFRPIE